MADFITEHFIDPILSNGWFNPVNTAVYSLVLIGAVYVVYTMLKRMDVHIDRYFLAAIMPFIFWGSIFVTKTLIHPSISIHMVIIRNLL